MIQRATAEHIDLLVRASVGVLDDLPNYAGVVYDPDHTRRMMEVYMRLPDLGIFFEEEDGQVVGLIMGMIHPQWFTPTREMSELMFWVRPDHRKSPLARQLIKTMEEWAIPRGARKIFMAAGSGYETERVEKFYRRLGYKVRTVIACKNIPAGQADFLARCEEVR